jgi:predicted nucleic acid-binding Zn finger protein
VDIRTSPDHRTGFHPPVPIPDVTATEWQRALDEAGELDSSITERIIDTHGDRGVRAIEAVAERRVKQYLDFTVVVGHTDEYVIEGGGCTCKDSAYNLDADDDTERCWHVLAADIARRVGALDHHEMWYSEVREFV